MLFIFCNVKYPDVGRQSGKETPEILRTCFPQSLEEGIEGEFHLVSVSNLPSSFCKCMMMNLSYN